MTGVFALAGTPKPIVDLLQKEISTVVATPEKQSGSAFAMAAVIPQEHFCITRQSAGFLPHSVQWQAYTAAGGPVIS
jgi:hypothetical protein